MTDDGPARERSRSSEARAGIALVLGLLGVVLVGIVLWANALGHEVHLRGGGGLSPLHGAAFGIAALALAAWHLRTRTAVGRGMAAAGLALGVLSIVTSMGAFAAGSLYHSYLSAFAGRRNTGRRAHADWVGQPAPALTFTTLDGERIELAQFRGRPVVINFWATWCEPCRRELPHLNRLVRETPNVVVLCLSDESETTVRRFADRNPFDARVASVPEPPAPLSDVHSLPTNVFLDREGVIREVRVGGLDYESLRELADGTGR